MQEPMILNERELRIIGYAREWATQCIEDAEIMEKEGLTRFARKLRERAVAICDDCDTQANLN